MVLKLVPFVDPTEARWPDLVRWQFVGATGHRQDFFFAGPGDWDLLTLLRLLDVTL